MGSATADYFVVLAGMRTGSNLLEEYLNAMPGLTCHGEVFNPVFFARPNKTSYFGVSMDARERDPVRVIDVLRTNTDGMAGFRLFYDHDPRVISHVLADPRAAKIILTRRPIDSYVSLKIARRTGQWWLGDLTTARKAKVAFDQNEYAEFLTTLREFQEQIARGLQTTGQTAFHIGYDDLADTDVIEGLGKYLGSDGPPDATAIRTKVQNPTPLSDRLTNSHEAEAALKDIGLPDLGQVPLHEPERGPGIRGFVAGQSLPLLYMPLRGAGHDPISSWIEAQDQNKKPISGMTQRDLRRWKRQHPGHRSFSIVRHPLPRAYDAFCRHILPAKDGNYSDLRAAMIETYKIPLPAGGPGDGYDVKAHRSAFYEFLVFLKGNLGGQTSLRVDNTWATQGTLLQAVAQFAVPDRVIREDQMPTQLVDIGQDAGAQLSDEVPGSFAVEAPFPLSDVADDAIQAACEAAYRRDFMMFGFERWSPETA